MTQPNQSPQPRSQTTNWLIAIVILLLLVIAVFLALLLVDSPFGGDGTAGATTTTTSTTSTTVANTTTTTEATTTTTTASSTTTTTVPPTTTTTLAPNERAAVAAVSAWVDALADGNVDASWALVAPSSQEIIGGRNGYDAIVTGLAEGFGSWAEAADPNGEGSPWVFVNEVDDQLLVVTLAGTVTQEGTTAVRAASIPVVVLGDTVAVQPFLRLDPVQWTDPPFTVEPWALAPNTRATVTVQGAPPVVMAFLGADDVDTSSEPGEGISTVVTEPLEDLEAGGTYVLTILLLDEEVIHADAVLVVGSESS